MAASLKLAFSASGGKKVSFSFSPADTGAAGEQVKTLMQVIAANGDIYTEPPLGLIGAHFDVHTVVPVSID